MTFGEKILRLRKEKGLSQEELALQITVSRQAVSRWEKEISTPDTENIVQLCKLFNVSSDYLLNDDYNENAASPVIEGKSAYLKEGCQRKPLLIISVILAGIGAFGNLIIWLLSTAYLLQIPNALVLAGTDTTYLSDTWTRDYSVFVEHYHLGAIVGVLWFFFAAGVILLCFWLLFKRKRPNS